MEDGRGIVESLSQSSAAPSSLNPGFPALSNSPPNSPGLGDGQSAAQGEDEEPAVAKSFDRSSNPKEPTCKKQLPQIFMGADDGVCKMHKFSLYETISRFYLVGADTMDQRFRILKIDRTADSGDLSVSEDDTNYSKKEMSHLLNAIDDGNKSSGGLQLRSSTWGLLGFIRFTSEYYMLLITKRSQVAMLGGHYIYQIDGTELVSLISANPNRSRVEKHPEEARFVGILNNLDLSRSFYFSYSYDITNSLQRNIRHERDFLQWGSPTVQRKKYNEMFIWNRYLLEPATRVLRNAYDWCLPIIHGFVDQATLSIYGRAVYITIVARRSRFFAGARFLKRGANDLGYVANDVETEQIVSDMLTTSFHSPGPRLYASPSYTSYVQHRGSIPLYWTQDSTGVTPKPDIELNLVDPFYGAAALHFDNLFSRYGAPIYVLNLVKARERTPRESKLLREFTNAVKYLNQFLPEDKKIVYKAWDMSRASKSRDQDVIGTLQSIASDVLRVTGFFKNGDGHESPLRIQNGVARTNCIDCLDRTNAAQFVIGKLALGHQLHALGVISNTSIEYDTDAVNLFTHMYHDHGDTIAIQYGGSHLVNTMETYRKINQWTSHSRDMVESFKRYYNNSFLDGQRQEAYNLFLGNYVFVEGQPMLWDLSTDYYLHHADPRSWRQKKQRSYVQWYHPEHLKPFRIIPSIETLSLQQKESLELYDDYWLEYYRPLSISTFLKIFSFRMNSTLRYIPFKSSQDGKYDLSPFRIRDGHEQETPEKPRVKKEVTIVDPMERSREPEIIHHSAVIDPNKDKSTPGWLQFQRTQPRILKDPRIDLAVEAVIAPNGTDIAVKDKTAMTQWTLNQFVVNSLSPSVAASEMAEYGRYISHPLSLPLVISAETPPTPNLEFVSYVQGVFNGQLANSRSTEEDIADYTAFLEVGDDPLTVTEADTPKKRYKAYRQWLKGKSLFKQSRLDL